MNTDNRVIVATVKHTNKVARVCEDWDSYDEWVEDSDWEKSRLGSYDAKIRKPDGDTVVVVIHSDKNRPVKVCGNWRIYDEWIENSIWDDSDVETCEAKVL